MRILITGGSGFIGTNVVDYYLSQGFDVLSVDKNKPKKIQHLKCYKEVNIEDIKQTIMQDYFVMFLLADIGNSKYSFKEIKDGLMEVANELKMELWVQKKQIFDKMHTI